MKIRIHYEMPGGFTPVSVEEIKIPNASLDKVMGDAQRLIREGLGFWSDDIFIPEHRIYKMEFLEDENQNP